MPTMREIYTKHSYEYDELVSHEDYQNNLSKTLLKHFDFKDKTVIELGTGTGRLTKLYIQQVEHVYCFDRSQHMLEKAKENLRGEKDKVTFDICDNEAIDSIQQNADIVIEGWSFGHTVGDNKGQIEQTVEKLFSDCSALLNPNGTVIIIETLGTNMKKAGPPSDSLKQFYELLENKHCFTQQIIETDYLFKSALEAERIMGYFFGEEMSTALQHSPTKKIKEYTGFWYKKF